MKTWPHTYLVLFLALWLPATQTLALVPGSNQTQHSAPPHTVAEHFPAKNGALFRVHLYTGEQMDPDLGFYYLRARYNNPDTGRFWTMDSYEGTGSNPLTLHKYIYCHDNPENGMDPSGHEFTLSGMLSVVGISDIVQSIKSFKDIGFQAGMKELQRELMNDASFTDLPENQQFGLLGEAAWIAYLNSVGFKAVQLHKSISANGPDIIAVGQVNGRTHLIIGEVKASRKLPGLGLLRKLQDNIRQMSSTWIDRYASAIADSLVQLGLSYVGAGILPAISRGEIDLYLLSARRELTGGNWELRGFRMLHLGDNDVELVGGGLPQIERPHTFYYP